MPSIIIINNNNNFSQRCHPYSGFCYYKNIKHIRHLSFIYLLNFRGVHFWTADFSSTPAHLHPAVPAWLVTLGVNYLPNIIIILYIMGRGQQWHVDGGEELWHRGSAPAWLDEPPPKTRGPEKTTHTPSASLTLGQRLRRWPNVKSALGRRAVFSRQADVLAQRQPG